MVEWLKMNVLSSNPSIAKREREREREIIVNNITQRKILKAPD
jgi:hypothetical protein